MPVTVSDDPIAVDAGEPCLECCDETPPPVDPCTDCTIPNDLCLTLIGTGGAVHLDGATADFSWDGVDWSKTGGHASILGVLRCCPDGRLKFSGTITDVCESSDALPGCGDALPDYTATCDPFEVAYRMVNQAPGSFGCTEGATLDVVITEGPCP